MSCAGVKRMCDWPGCEEWGVASLRLEYRDGTVSRKVACQQHLDKTVADADEKQIGVVDER